ncbi:MFS general substrate transporter [Penicillium longicatenatum]|uniref:MFS general substrate transporter n=1 Tax=Penicillium longicatenatum TaxID=1561947 RepID=UPI00254970E0|nr:MFS general substrate transporter [Penicillium longicatenatum]KAJ5631143.1 MFS general substrate transporter [Penicillium longicatenatum]
MDKSLPSLAVSRTIDVENKPNDRELFKKPEELIDFDGPNDPEHPQNLSLLARVWATFMLALFNLVVAIASSIFGSAQAEVAKEFHVSEEVTVLGTSLYLVGYILGPLIFGPVSEKFGRKYPMIVGVTVSGLFTLMPALGRNLTTIFLGRFLAALFGVAPKAVLGGVITDCWDTVYRGVATACCICLVFSGPTFGPLFGGFIVAGLSGWRWAMWVCVIATLSISFLAVFTYPETYPPNILQKKTQRLRKESGNETLSCALDIEETSFRYLARIYLIRPWALFFSELILVLITLYQAFIYGLMFLFYQSFPIAFGEVRGWKMGISSLSFLAILVGIFFGTGVVVLYTEPHVKRHVAKYGKFEPELRLPVMIFGGCLVPVGLLWYGWTSRSTIPWPSEVCSGVLIGCGMYIIFIQSFAYIVDCYPDRANSAMAANGAVRSIFGASFPLFARYMFENLGVNWVSTLLGIICLAMSPVQRYGAQIRIRPKVEGSGD